MFKHVQSVTVAATFSVLLAGCAQQSGISIEQAPVQTPASWSQQTKVELTEQDKNWLAQTIDSSVLQAVETALNNNFELQQQKLAVEALEQTAIASGATLWPSLNLSFANSRRKQAGYSTSHDLSLSASYELDLWGKLAANDRQVNLQLASQKAQLEQFKQNLIAQVILAWFAAVEAEQQLNLSKQRHKNSQQNLSIIESGYESGLNSALDVYLSRSEEANEQSRVASSETSLVTAVTQLELLLGTTPSGNFAVTSQDIPEVSATLNPGVPSEVIANKPSLGASWLSLMAQDAGLAFAHKQRFPSISLTASLGTGSSELGDLLSSDLGWSLIGNITQPIFNAGRLKANEEKARIETKQAEQGYLSDINQAFADVENGLSKAQNLQISHNAFKAAAENAQLAQQLSFEQYLKGLVSYTTVLDAQTRAFNAQSSLIQSKYQLLENRLQLHLALGGNFNSIVANGSAQL